MVDEGRQRRARESAQQMVVDEEGVSFIYVVAHPDHGNRVALWERHPDHPGGEVLIHGQDGPPVEVAVTPAVLEALAPQGERGEGSSRLVRLEGKALEQRQQLALQAGQAALAKRGLMIASRTIDPPEDGSASAADLLAGEAAREQRVEELEKQVKDLEGKLEERRVQFADQLGEDEEKRYSDPDTIEREAAERERLGRVARTPAHLDTYDAEEPKQGLDAHSRRPKSAGRSNVARPVNLRDDAAGRNDPVPSQSAVPPPSPVEGAEPKK